MANITVSPDVDTFLKKQNKGEMSDFIGPSAELLVELKLRSSSGNNCEVVNNPTGAYAHRQDIVGEWNPVEITDPQDCWSGNTFTAPSTGLYLFDIGRVDFSVKAQGPNAGTSSSTGSYGWFTGPAPRGAGLIINNVPYVLTEATHTSSKSTNMAPIIQSYAGFNPTSLRSSWAVQLTENDTCQLATMMPFAASAWSTYHLAQVSTNTYYTKAHKGPTDSPIKIYKLA